VDVSDELGNRFLTSQCFMFILLLQGRAGAGGAGCAEYFC